MTGTAPNSETADTELLSLDTVSIAFRTRGHLRTAVDQASLRIRPGETMALVGESGSGKTLLARAMVGLMPAGAEITSGHIRFRGHDIVAGGEQAFRALRGKDISFVFQEPLSSLNPSLRVGLQLTEGLAFHCGVSPSQCREQALHMLDRVKINNPAEVMSRYPHELSGGMRQRVMIATALIMKPALMVADEPTTALDMIVQEEVLLLMREVAQELSAAMLLITHDLSAVAALAQSVSVMKEGRMVEVGSVEKILRDARDPYTQKLLAATPQALDHPESSPVEAAAPNSPVLQVNQLRVSFPAKAQKFGQSSIKRRPVNQVLENVSFSIAAGETLAIIGESGSGKTTLSRSIAGLQTASAGTVLFKGEPVSGLNQATGSSMQFIFQDPFGSLDPRMKVADIITEGLMFRSGLTREQRRRKAILALAEVELDESFIHRFPHQLSGGQRQRVSIARAIIMHPEFILADEPVSALDLTVQKQIIDLLQDLKRRIGFACLFVSHDLGVVEQFADRVGVLYRGRLVEIGSTADIFARPRHPYTRQLLTATPHLQPVAGQDTDQCQSYRLHRRSFANANTCADIRCFDPPAGSTPFHYQQLEAGHFVAVQGESAPTSTSCVIF